MSVLASPDTEELIRHKGIHGGLLELLRPFGEQIQGKVTIRDSSGASRSWNDFAVRFVGVKDGLESPRIVDRRSIDSSGSQKEAAQRLSLPEYRPARLRTGGDVSQIEEVLDRHLTFAEEQSGPLPADYLNHKDDLDAKGNGISPFYTLYLRRMLSGLPMTPSETFSHPVASVIAISSRSPSPIEELRTLYASSNTGEHRLPQWVHNEFLRYYVLVHDEDYDDITKSMSLFDQMKRHFGLHCHLLRLRSTQCLPSDDDSIKLPICEWVSAAEELAEIVLRESNEDDDDPMPCIFESDATAIRAFVREMVTQSIVPSMERASATWNDQVASRRRGISGRFMSLSKRWTPFAGRSATGPNLGAGGSNYDSLQGFYRPDAPEAIMRKLADYAVMLRDFKLAQSTYDILCGDFKNDKAWRYYAGANEMAAITTLLTATSLSAKVRTETIDQLVETGYYSYITRCGAPYNALRTLMLCLELLKIRGGSALDDCARWAGRVLDDRLVGPIGHVLVMERISSCFTERKGLGLLSSGDRKRKAAFWNTLSTDAWLKLDKTSRAEQCLAEATRLYGNTAPDDKSLEFEAMQRFLDVLQANINANRVGPQPLDGSKTREDDEQTLVEPLQEQSEQLDQRPPGHRKSMSGITPLSVQTAFDPLGAAPLSPHAVNATPMSPHAPNTAPRSPVMERTDPRDDGFE